MQRLDLDQFSAASRSRFGRSLADSTVVRRFAELQPPGRPGCKAASVIRGSPADRISKTPAVRIRDKDKPAMTAACGSDDSGCAGGPSRRDRPPRLAALSRQIRRDTVPGAVKFAAHETGGPSRRHRSSVRLATLEPEALVARAATASGAFLADRAAFWLSVWLADRVVPWHTFNLVGFGPVNFQARHSKYQGSRRQAETLSLYRRCVDLSSQALTFS